ncbi:MAG: hypothetical protein QW735_02455 [archaeon]
MESILIKKIAFLAGGLSLLIIVGIVALFFISHQAQFVKTTVVQVVNCDAKTKLIFLRNSGDAPINTTAYFASQKKYWSFNMSLNLGELKSFYIPDLEPGEYYLSSEVFPTVRVECR